ncbi:HpcH/HpaI aldolase/citrate lyase family protein [Orrella sp. NBD-18]|uniref:HpcH/HpaI aldolase/citrate lyase family protein n=1 Tax=Sheuella amnicola TaxID=2707330 RepID=A0A6B2QYX7_9BURK|nr:HpcH/HpaI aldolase/citrate lyase family protein [Sheuella amnicola]NDY81927.1 HpcH/HpaI aldolase/citrate lyase family protein [Sheuella amnicola]HBI83668.1 2-keto-3-deoxy-L-rhamnonate aldolase [Alcaligenaceae bacterium]
MPDYTNRFKKSLKEGRANIGLWISLPTAFTTEICATAEFDWMLLDGEHTPTDPLTIMSQLQACAAYNTQAVARPPIGETYMIKQLLDLGVQNLLIPMVDTPEQAKELVRAVRYPPHGIRGVGYGSARVSRWDSRKDYVKGANEEVCLLVQVETATGLGNIDAICAVDGVDGVFLGPSDISAALGHLGNPGHPEVVAEIERCIAIVLKHGKAAGILTPDRNLAKRYLELGCTFVAVGADARILALGARELRAAFPS